MPSRRLWRLDTPLTIPSLKILCGSKVIPIIQSNVRVRVRVRVCVCVCVCACVRVYSSIHYWTLTVRVFVVFCMFVALVFP